MRKVLRNALAVGALTVAILVAIYFSIIYFSEEYAKETYSYYALFNDATGLVEKTYVKMAGIEVGSIVAITLSEGKERIDIKVSSDYTLYKNAVIAKRSSSLVTGEYYLALTPGTPDRAVIPPGGQILLVVEGTEMESMAARLDDITRDVKTITSSLAHLIGTPEGKDKLARILDDLEGVADNLNLILQQNSQLVQKTVQNVEGIAREARPEMREILENIKTITANIKEIIKAQEGEVGETVADLKGSVKTLNAALEKLDRTMGNVEEVSEKVKEGKGVVGKLLKDEEVADHVADIAEGAGGLLKSLSRLQLIVSLRSDYNFLASTMKTYVGVYIHPKEDKFYMIEVIDDPRGKQEVEELQVITTNPEEVPTWKETRIKKSQAMKFSFMFGRRISFLTFRFGLKESTGGIGIDIFFLKDSLKIESDLYDFDSNVYPRLKVAAALQFLRKIYILGGVDDVLSRDTRDYFIGAQLRFTDEDLLGVLAVAPTGTP